jgi:predicted O-linked N-acetylglucosamine transferase (SPINDLY family)
LPADGHLYLCPQSLFKIHPEFDHVLAGILRADPKGHIVILGGSRLAWVKQLGMRWQGSMPDVAERVLFVARQHQDQFMHLLAVCDVMLDPLHFGGGNTSLEAFASGTPIVTLAGKFMRSRVTYAYYQQMGVLDLVAADAEEYVRIAVRLCTDGEWQRNVCARIAGACHRLYENAEFVRDLEQFLRDATARAARRDGDEHANA